MEQGLVEIRYNTMTTASTESFKVLRTNLIFVKIMDDKKCYY